MPRAESYGVRLISFALALWASGGSWACVGDSVKELTPPGDPPPARVWSAPENISQSATYSDIRINWGNSVAVDDSGGIHAIWREVVDPQASPLVAKVAYGRRDENGWVTADLSAETPGLGHPKIAAAAGQIYVLWHQYDPSPGGLDSLHLVRADAAGGAGSFGPPQTLVDDAPVMVSPAGELSTSPSIAASGDHVYVVWSDDRVVAACGFGVPEIYLLHSADQGAGWSAPEQVSSADCRSSWTPTVAARDATVHVAWTDERHNTDDCALGNAGCHEEEYYRRLTDYGATPQAEEVRLSNDDPGPPVQSWAGNITVSQSAVHYAWMDRVGGDGWEIYYARSDDDGLSWELPAQQLTEHAPGCESVRPTVASEGDAVHLVWFELCAGGGSGETATALHRWSADGGRSWSEVSDVTSGNAQFAIQPSVTVAGDTVHVVWNDQAEIWYATSTLD